MTTGPDPIQAGAVVRTRGWPTPGDPLSRERYLVTEVRSVPNSPFPVQVYTKLIDSTSAGYVLAQFHAFPIEVVSHDPVFQKQYERRLAAVKRRAEGGTHA